MCVTGCLWRIMPVRSIRSSITEKSLETYNIGGFNEWKNIDIIKVLINTVDRLLGRKEGEDLDLITYVTDRLSHDARYAMHPTVAKRTRFGNRVCNSRRGSRRLCHWYLDNQSGWIISSHSEIIRGLIIFLHHSLSLLGFDQDKLPL